MLCTSVLTCYQSTPDQVTREREQSNRPTQIAVNFYLEMNDEIIFLRNPNKFFYYELTINVAIN